MRQADRTRRSNNELLDPVGRSLWEGITDPELRDAAVGRSREAVGVFNRLGVDFFRWLWALAEYGPKPRDEVVASLMEIAPRIREIGADLLGVFVDVAAKRLSRLNIAVLPKFAVDLPEASDVVPDRVPRLCRRCGLPVDPDLNRDTHIVDNCHLSY